MKKPEAGSRKPETGKGSLRLRYSLFFLFFIFLLSTFVSLTFAQPGGGFQGGGLAEKQDRLQALITTRLVNGLGLTPDKAQKVTQIMGNYHLKRKEIGLKMRGLHMQLQSAADSSDPKQASLVVSELQKTRNEMIKLDDAMFDEIKPNLTPQQQAKFLLLMQQVRQEIMQLRRGGGPPPGGPPPGGNPPVGAPPASQ